MQEVSFNKNDIERNYGIYEFLGSNNYESKNMGAFNDNGYIYNIEHWDHIPKHDHLESVIGKYNTYFTIDKKSERAKSDYSLSIKYMYSLNQRVEPATLFELECAIQITYDFINYMLENNLVPGLSIPCIYLSDNKENSYITDIDEYNRTYYEKDMEVEGINECDNLYHEMIAYYKYRQNILKLENQKQQVKNKLKIFESIKDYTTNTRLYKHFKNKYIIAQAQKQRSKKLV